MGPQGFHRRAHKKIVVTIINLARVEYNYIISSINQLYELVGIIRNTWES